MLSKSLKAEIIFFVRYSSGIKSTFKCSSWSFAAVPGPYRGYAHASDIAQVIKRLEEIIEECAHAVRTRENDPVVSIEPEDGVNEVLFFIGRDDLDGRNLKHFRAQFEQSP